MSTFCSLGLDRAAAAAVRELKVSSGHAAWATLLLCQLPSPCAFSMPLQQLLWMLHGSQQINCLIRLSLQWHFACPLLLPAEALSEDCCLLSKYDLSRRLVELLRTWLRFSFCFCSCRLQTTIS